MRIISFILFVCLFGSLYAQNPVNVEKQTNILNYLNNNGVPYTNNGQSTVEGGLDSLFNRPVGIDTLSTLADTATANTGIGQLVYVNSVDQYWHVKADGFFYLLETGGGGAITSSGSFTTIDTTVQSDYTVAVFNTARITSFCDDGIDNTITLPTPVDSIKGNVIEITHLDTSASQGRTTTVETDGTSYHLYDNFTGDTLTFFNIYQSGQTVRFTLQEVEGVLRWVAVNLSPFVYGEKELTAVGKVRQSTAGDLSAYDSSVSGERKLQYQYTVDSVQEIQNLNLRLGDRVKVKNTEAEYFIQSDSVAGYNIDNQAVIQMASNYAILQPLIDGYNVEWWTGQDYEKIQSAINYSIHYKQAVVRLEGREYNLSQPVMIAIQGADGEYDFITVKIKGASSAYDSSINDGLTSIRTTTNSLPAIIVQKGRNVSIEGIYFNGRSGYLIGSTLKAMVDTTDAYWASKGGRTNRYSPYAAIVIDPFDDEITGEDQYPGLSAFYTNGSNGGTSMLRISDCSFDNWYIAIAHNPSKKVQNGDNVTLQHSSVRRTFCLWATGQTQSRANSINDIYAVGGVHTLISSTLIGDGTGNPPYCSNMNIAGGTKYLFSIFGNPASNFYMNGIYAESLWSFGTSSLNTFISGSSFKFSLLDEVNIKAPLFHMKASGPVSFNSCQIFYYSDCGFPMTMSFLTINDGHFEFRNCEFDAGLITNSVLPGNDADRSENIDFYNSYTSCLSVNRYSSGSENSEGRYGFARFNNQTHPLDHNGNGVFQFISTTPNLYKVNDPLFTKYNGPRTDMTASLGIVSNVNGDTITVVGATDNMNEDTDLLFLGYRIRYIDRVFADITTGSDTLKNISNIGLLSVGDFVWSETDVFLGRVIEKGFDYIILNINANISGNQLGIRFGDYTKTEMGTEPITGSWFTGDYVTNENQSENILRWICTQSGEFGSGDNEPVFEEELSGINDFQISTIDGFVPYRDSSSWKTVPVIPTFNPINYWKKLSGVSAAYSLRQINPDYSGPIVRIARSSDSTELNFSANAIGELDTNAIKAFVGGGDGWVVTWYDQEDIRDAVAITLANAPKIVSNGNMVLEGERIALDFDGSNDYLEFSATNLNGQKTIFAVARGRSANRVLVGRSTTNQEGLRVGVSTYLNSGNDDFSTNGYFYVNGELNSGSFYLHHIVFSNGNTANTINLRSISQNVFGAQWSGTVQEVVISSNDLSPERDFITNSISAYYDLFESASTGINVSGEFNISGTINSDFTATSISDSDRFYIEQGDQFKEITAETAKAYFGIALTGTGSPSGSVTPDFIGQIYIDTTTAGSEVAYLAVGTGNTDWKQITN